MNKKKLLAQLTNQTGILTAARAFSAPNLMIFNYHRIYDNILSTDYDEGVFAHSKEIFWEHMTWLKKHFTVIDENELIEMVKTGSKLTTNTAFITFDDGYIDNYDLAYPILRDLDLPATFFIPCNQIEGISPPWWDQIAYIIKSTKVTEFEFEKKSYQLKQFPNRNKLVNLILRIFKSAPYTEVENKLALLEQVCQQARPTTQELATQFMSWEQIKEVSQNKISIGSHTMNHNILANLALEQQKIELTESKNFLAEKIGKPIKTIAYPVGGPTAFTVETEQLTSEVGYELGFSFINGYYKSSDLNRYAIRRIELANDNNLFKAQVSLPTIF